MARGTVFFLLVLPLSWLLMQQPGRSRVFTVVASEVFYGCCQRSRSAFGIHRSVDALLGRPLLARCGVDLGPRGRRTI